MEYSIEEVSELARVSVRTLRYYDQIDLLKPAFRMVNGRRYYGQKEFITLLDILHFKKLKFSLKKIKSMLTTNLDKRALVFAKKKFLQEEINQPVNAVIKITNTVVNL